MSALGNTSTLITFTLSHLAREEASGSHAGDTPWVHEARKISTQAEYSYQGNDFRKRLVGSDLWPVLEHTHVCGSLTTSPHGKNFLSVDDHFERCFIWKKWPDSLLIPTYELVAGNIIIMMIIFKLFQEKKLLCGQRLARHQMGQATLKQSEMRPHMFCQAEVGILAALNAKRLQQDINKATNHHHHHHRHHCHRSVWLL